MSTFAVACPQDLSQIDTDKEFTASSIVKSINVLTSIHMIKQAWDRVKPETIMHCFRHCGAIPCDPVIEEDPFASLDDGEETSLLEDLVHEFDPSMTAQEYVSADDDLSTRITFEDTDSWREELRLMTCDDCQSSKRSELELEDELEDEEVEEQTTIKSIDVALTTAVHHTTSNGKYK